VPRIEGLVEGYTLVARPSRRGQSPPHLRPHQEALARASREAAEASRHLRGEARVRAMNRLVAERLRRGRSSS